jgi:glycosyltransferase involved in cell wall biosynthesis
VRQEAGHDLMRIAYLDPHPVPGDAPEALQILYTVDALGEIGVDVELVTPRPRGALAAESILGRPLSPRVRLHDLPDVRKRWWFPSASNQPFYFMAVRKLRELRADVVMARNLKMAEYLLKRKPGVPLLFETHEVFAQTYREEHPVRSAREERKLAALAAREGFVYRGSAVLLALTPLLLEDVRKAYGIDRPAAVAPDGVDLRQAAAASGATHNPVPVLLYLGSLHPWKGVDVLIRAMRHLSRPARLMIAGGTAQRIRELTELAGREGVAASVEFVGPVPPGERFGWIGRGDICLLPLTRTSIASRYTSPLKLFEYMAAGKPIVLSDLPSMRAILRHREHAIMVPPEDAPALARAVDELLADPALRARIGRAARDLVARFSWTSRAQTIVHSARQVI